MQQPAKPTSSPTKSISSSTSNTSQTPGSLAPLSQPSQQLSQSPQIYQPGQLLSHDQLSQSTTVQASAAPSTSTPISSSSTTTTTNTTNTTTTTTATTTSSWATDNVIIDIEQDDDPTDESSHKPSQSQKDANNGQPSAVREGLHIHYGTDGKRLCSYSKKLCQQRRMESYGYCIKHILEDPAAPFTQCQFNSKQTRKQCTNPVSVKEQDTRYCAAHKQILGLMPRKIPQQKKLKKKPNEVSPTTTSNPDLVKLNHKKLARALNKQGIVHSAAFQTMRYAASTVPSVPVRSLSSTPSSEKLAPGSPTKELPPDMNTAAISTASSPTIPPTPGTPMVMSPLPPNATPASHAAAAIFAPGVRSFATSPSIPASPAITRSQPSPALAQPSPAQSTSAQPSPAQLNTPSIATPGKPSVASSTPTLTLPPYIQSSIPRTTPTLSMTPTTTTTTTTTTTRPPLTPVSTPQPLLMNLVIHSDSESSSSFPSSSSSSSSEKASDDEESAEVGGAGDMFYSGEFVENCNFDSDSDSDYFRDIHIVTEEELIRRRRDKIRKLLKLYKAQFKRLKDKLRKRHFRYLKGKSTSNSNHLTDLPNKPGTGSSLTNTKQAGGEYDGSGSENENTHRRPTRHCNAPNCSAKRIPPTIYCFSHILMDQNQKLFKSCSFTAPEVVCSTPILATQQPPFCSNHIEIASATEKQIDKKRKEPEPTVSEENFNSTKKIAKNEKDSSPSPQQKPPLSLSHAPVPLSVPIVPVSAHPTPSSPSLTLSQTALSSSSTTIPSHPPPSLPSSHSPHLPHPPSHLTILPTARLAETFSAQTQILLGQIQEKEKSGSVHHVDSKNSHS